ncbi:MAG: hypothetical protein ABL857_00730 [Rickettsiales bacterium]|jgi:hypothetical protein
MEKQTIIEKTQILSDISQQTILLMGSSFVLGSMFTLFALLILDWVRRDANEK